MDYRDILYKWYPEDSNPVHNERETALDYICEAVSLDPTIEQEMRIVGLMESQQQFINAIRHGELS